VVCQGGTDFSKATSENKLIISTEATDDLSVDEEEAPPDAAKATPEKPAAETAAKPADAKGEKKKLGPTADKRDVDDLAKADDVTKPEATKADADGKTAAAGPAAPGPGPGAGAGSDEAPPA
jgi:hypothetical protein